MTSLQVKTDITMCIQIIYAFSYQTKWITGEKTDEYFIRLTGQIAPATNTPMNQNALLEILQEDKILLGMLLGLATFGENVHVRSFLESNLLLR